MLRPDRCLMCKSIVYYLIFTLLLVFSIPSDVRAMFIPSNLSSVVSAERQVSAMGINKEVDLLKIRTFLETKIVAQRLTDLGLSAQEVLERLSQLSEEQIHNIATKIDGIKPGGDSGLGIIISLLVIAILVIIILQMTGHKVIIVK